MSLRNPPTPSAGGCQEFVNGTDLAQELVGKPWTEIKVLGLLREIIEIVKVAHREQVIHKISSLPTSFAVSQMET